MNTMNVTAVRRWWATVLGIASLVAMLGLMTGCGPEKQVSEPAPPVNNAPPGGASVDEYQAQMQKMKGTAAGGAKAPVGYPPSGPK